ncbi:MAG: YggS family pyridoxal phosphate-dependent enzyme [Desulfocapsaceae bacterium]|jgi:pyridoxal phosphate enzyme (YggS family)|nr:YggS family pyridoxal phosphate-dependent enzyme [Desulfocapsaceae bacterium]
MIKDNLAAIQQNIHNTALACGRDPKSVRLVAVSKRFPPESILEAREAGQMLFGENYLQEAAEKKELLKDRVQFHFIGHLQSNKARVAAELFDMIETIDRVKIASALDRHLQQLNKKLAVLIQVNVGYDSEKSGVLPERTEALLKEISRFTNLQPTGLMTMPPFTEDPAETRKFFRGLRCLAEELQSKELLPEHHVELSMGMSADYPIAIEEGATLIRIGTAIFGQRPHK